MDTKETVYVGILIRDEIRRQQLKNGYVINKLKDAGIEMSDAMFSNKIYGERDQFKENEIKVINQSLGTNF